MDDFVELKLSREIAATDTSYIRASIRDRIEADGLDGPPVELVQFHVFIHCTRGTGQHMVDFEDFELRHGTALWIRPGQVQRWSDIDDDFDADVAVFESAVVPELPLFDHFAGGASIAQLGSDSPSLQEQMNWMAADLKVTGDGSIAAAVVGVVLRLFARHAATGHNNPQHRLANSFTQSVDNNIGQRSVSWHAQQIGASPRSVARATDSALNLRPKEVVDSRVILEAQRRLAWSNDGIAVIARALGFSEASNFAKFFRGRTGRTPSDFRTSIDGLDTKGSLSVKN